MNYSIEQAKIENLDDIYNIQKDYEHTLISKEALKNDLENIQCIYFIAKDENKNIIGCIGGTVLVDNLDISIVITDKGYVKKGIASSLLQQMIQYCKEKNILKIFLEVRSSNITAIKLYEKYNFKQISIRKNYYPDNKEDALIYMLEI